mgnify:CR=1 FL=1|tara:strand:+ start:83 stop:331 length:249 start_codon:yes stop_codon:yes gene_type:complete
MSWKERKRPICLEKRFEFDSYDSTRDFLDKLGDHSEAIQRFPDISFGRTYVNITIRPEDDGAEVPLSDADRALAIEIDDLFG